MVPSIIHYKMINCFRPSSDQFDPQPLFRTAPVRHAAVLQSDASDWSTAISPNKIKKKQVFPL